MEHTKQDYQDVKSKIKNLLSFHGFYVGDSRLSMILHDLAYEYDD